MNLRSYLRFLSRSWEWIAIFTLVGIVAAMGYSLSRTPMFVATSEIFLSTPRFGNVTDNTSPYLADDFSQKRARSYVQLASRPDLARRVIDKLGIDMRPEDLAAATSASMQPDTVVMEVGVKANSPDDAKLLADAVVAQLASDIRMLESPAGLRVPVVEPVVTQPAETPTKPIAPSIWIYFIFGASGGFLVGITVASLLEQSRVERTAVEQFTGRPVLGTVVYNSLDSKGSAHAGSSAADQLRLRGDAIRDNVRVEIERAGDRVLAITTADGSHRSSTMAAVLALAFARADSRVILVSTQPIASDGPLSRESSSVGLAEVIAGDAQLGEAIQPGESKNLYYLVGPTPDKLTALLQSEKLRGVVDELRQTFDLVIVDIPGFLQLAGSTRICEVVDSAILVMRDGLGGKRNLASAMRTIDACHARLLGSILESHSSGGLYSAPQRAFVTLSERADQ